MTAWNSTSTICLLGRVYEQTNRLLGAPENIEGDGGVPVQIAAQLWSLIVVLGVVTFIARYNYNLLLHAGNDLLAIPNRTGVSKLDSRARFGRGPPFARAEHPDKKVDLEAAWGFSEAREGAFG